MEGGIGFGAAGKPWWGEGWVVVVVAVHFVLVLMMMMMPRLVLCRWLGGGRCGVAVDVVPDGYRRLEKNGRQVFIYNLYHIPGVSRPLRVNLMRDAGKENVNARLRLALTYTTPRESI